MDRNHTRQNRVLKNYNLAVRNVTRWGGTEYMTNDSSEEIRLGQSTLSFRKSRVSDLSTDPYAVAKQLEVDIYKNPLDNGHEFYTRKNEMDLACSFLNYRSPNTVEGYSNEHHGPVWIRPRSEDLRGDFDFYGDAFRINMNIIGSDFINRTIPTQSHASAAQFLGELKEGLPDILGFDWKRSMKFKPSRDGGDLSLAFGWVPFVKDLTKMFTAVVNSKQLIEQYVRNSAEYGATVRRIRESDPVIEVLDHSIYADSNFPAGLARGSHEPYWRGVANRLGGVTAMGSVRRFETRKETYRFTSRYQYFINEADDILSRMENYATKANYILGFRLTPDVLWELTPWSWLVDWQADVGTLLSNAQSFANGDLVMQYAYLQQEIVNEVSYSLLDGYLLDSNTKIDPSSLYRTVTKSRVRASPYGFGVSSDKFTDSQINTLLSLVSKGSSNAPKHD